MARRSSRNELPWQAQALGLVGVGGIGLHYFGAFDGGALTSLLVTMLVVVTAIVAVPAALFFYILRRKGAAFDARLEEQMTEHLPALVSLYRRTRKRDDFGNIDDALWRKKINLFLEKQVYRGDDFREWSKTDSARQVADKVDAFVAGEARKETVTSSGTVTKVTSLSPTQYEALCAKILQKKGWKTRRTPASGDSGADVLAQKGPIRLVVQCKLYTGPVGNKAVQEVYSAKALYNCTHACVVAPSGYSRQARYEAEGHNIRLLHHAELGAYAEMITKDLAEAQAASRQPMQSAS